MDFQLPVVPTELFWIAAVIMVVISLIHEIFVVFYPAFIEKAKRFIPHFAIIGSIAGCLINGVPIHNAVMFGFAIGVFAAGMFDTFVKPFVKK